MDEMYRRQNYYNQFMQPEDPYNYLYNMNYYNNYNMQYGGNNMYNNQNYIKDYGPDPFVVDIEKITKENNRFRVALWTGEHLQLTLMSLNVGESIGLEQHNNNDQFIRIEQGTALVKMGDSQNNLDFQRRVTDDMAFVIPAGKWHDLVNIGNIPVKLYSIYAPPQHPKGTVHNTKMEAEAAERKNIQ